MRRKDVSGIVTLRVIAKLGEVSVGISLGKREVAKVDVAGEILVFPLHYAGSNLYFSRK